jgi:hypothetical protein
MPILTQSQSDFVAHDRERDDPRFSQRRLRSNLRCYRHVGAENDDEVARIAKVSRSRVFSHGTHNHCHTGISVKEQE